MDFLTAYRASAARFPKPSVTVDLVIFTVLEAQLQLLLIERGEEPFKGRWALPGGFVRVGDTMDDRGEDLEEAARRELVEETGLELHDAWLEQVGAFGHPDRDPRMRIISIAHTALVRPTLAPQIGAGSDAADARWFALDSLPELAFDHADIVDAAVTQLRRRLEGSSIAFELVPERFTVAELREVYQALLGEPQDAGNFRRRFRRLESDGIVQATDERRPTNTKPARLYRFERA